jgi:hypothetical protein
MRLKLIFLSAMLTATAALASAQTNLLQNPQADMQSQSWRTHGQATVETCATDNPCFVVRSGGYFIQDVSLSSEAIGQYALLIASGSSERINADGAITGLPYLYGYMMDAGNPRGDYVLDYLQGQNMRALASRENEWVIMWGIFRVPEGTRRIRFFLNQAERKGVPHNGSAARFDDVGLYLFATEQDARAFATARH